MEVSRVGVELELQLEAYVIATEMPDPRHVWDLHHRLWQCQILNPLREDRDGIHILIDTSQVPNPLSHNENSHVFISSWSTVWQITFHPFEHVASLSFQEGLPNLEFFHDNINMYLKDKTDSWRDVSDFNLGAEMIWLSILHGQRPKY